MKTVQMTPATLAANKGHMRNYICMERFMGQFKVHCGLGLECEHAAYIQYVAEDLFGRKAQVTDIKMDARRFAVSSPF